MKGDQFSEYHCTAEWHISRMKSRWALAVYNFALRISDKSGRFFCSAEKLSNYFKCNEKSIRRAFKELLDAGFFELTHQGFFEPNGYKPVRHPSWAEKHPGCCVTKLEFPWSGECSRLGQALWSASGGQARFATYQVEFLKRLGFSDEVIVSEFTAFWVSQGHRMRADQFKSNRKLLIGQFITLMNGKVGKHVASS